MEATWKQLIAHSEPWPTSSVGTFLVHTLVAMESAISKGTLGFITEFVACARSVEASDTFTKCLSLAIEFRMREFEILRVFCPIEEPHSTKQPCPYSCIWNNSFVCSTCLKRPAARGSAVPPRWATLSMRLKQLYALVELGKQFEDSLVELEKESLPTALRIGMAQVMSLTTPDVKTACSVVQGILIVHSQTVFPSTIQWVPETLTSNTLTISSTSNTHTISSTSNLHPTSSSLDGHPTSSISSEHSTSSTSSGHLTSYTSKKESKQGDKAQGVHWNLTPFPTKHKLLHTLTQDEQKSSIVNAKKRPVAAPWSWSVYLLLRQQLQHLKWIQATFYAEWPGLYATQLDVMPAEIASCYTEAAHHLWLLVCSQHSLEHFLGPLSMSSDQLYAYYVQMIEKVNGHHQTNTIQMSDLLQKIK